MNLILQFNYLKTYFFEDDDKIQRRDVLKLAVRRLATVYVSFL